MAGHIKIDRKILNWEWYTDVIKCKLFFHLLLKANWKDGVWRGHPVKRGQLITGRIKLSEETGLTERQVRVTLDALKVSNEIAIKATNQFSLITICKYDTYQSGEVENTEKTPAKRPTERPTNDQQSVQQNATIEEVKNNKVFNTKPLPEHFNGLPEIKIGAAIEFVRITKQATLKENDVKDIWSVFKIQNLTGKKYYEDEDAVYSHFLNWIKKQDFTNGQSITTKAGSVSKDYKSAGASVYADRIKSGLDKVKASRNNND